MHPSHLCSQQGTGVHLTNLPANATAEHIFKLLGAAGIGRCTIVHAQREAFLVFPDHKKAQAAVTDLQSSQLHCRLVSIGPVLDSKQNDISLAGSDKVSPLFLHSYFIYNSFLLFSSFLLS